MEMTFPQKWELYYRIIKNNDMNLIKKFNKEELLLILEDMKKKNKLKQYFVLPKELLKVSEDDKYNSSALKINIGNLSLVDPELIKKKTKKVTIIMASKNTGKSISELLAHFEKIQSIPNKFVEFNKQYEYRLKKSLDEVNKLDCTFINPFYLYFESEPFPEKVIWKMKADSPIPPQRLIELYPEFEIYRTSNEMIDLETQLKRANVALKEKRFGELKTILDPLYDYELSEDEELMLRKPFKGNKLIYLPLINNPMVAHLLSNQTFLSIELNRVYRTIKWEKIYENLIYYQIPYDIRLFIIFQVPELESDGNRLRLKLKS
ncbi:MAG: hypothetical protein CMM93_05995 [Rickettsiales bacterium]|nr:hypothetical protein [Rickettsiales bacterium]